MSIQENKALVLKACHYLSERNMPALSDLIHEEGSWTLPYRPDMFQFGGCNNKQAANALLTQFLSGFDRFSFAVTGVTAENNRVAIEARSEGIGPGKAHYRNNYNIIFTLKDGKVFSVREFFDPFEVVAYIDQLTV